jgi:hypothetical protein
MDGWQKWSVRRLLRFGVLRRGCRFIYSLGQILRVGAEVFQVSRYCYVYVYAREIQGPVTLREVVQYNNFSGLLLRTCGLFIQFINSIIKKSELCMSNVADNLSCPTTVSDGPSYRIFENIVAWFGR